MASPSARATTSPSTSPPRRVSIAFAAPSPGRADRNRFDLNIVIENYQYRVQDPALLAKEPKIQDFKKLNKVVLAQGATSAKVSERSLAQAAGLITAAERRLTDPSECMCAGEPGPPHGPRLQGAVEAGHCGAGERPHERPDLRQGQPAADSRPGPHFERVRRGERVQPAGALRRVEAGGKSFLLCPHSEHTARREPRARAPSESA